METIGRFINGRTLGGKLLLFGVEISPRMFLTFRAGQYVHLEWIDPPLPEAKGEGLTLFVASPPAELPFLSFLTRRGESPFKKCLAKAAEGMPLIISGPFGSFTLPGRLGGAEWLSPIILIMEGVGISVARSLILDGLPRAPTLPFFLLFLARPEETLPLRSQWMALERKHPNFRFEEIFLEEGPEGLPAEPAGLEEPGDLVLPRVFEIVGERDTRRSEFYLSGSLGVVESLRRALLCAGIPSERIHTEPCLGLS